MATVATAIAHLRYPPRAAAAATGNTTPSTAAAHLIPTEPLRIGSAVIHAAILWPTDRQMHGETLIRGLGNSLQGAAICRTVAEVPVLALEM
jgi:hypothetical protein